MSHHADPLDGVLLVLLFVGKGLNASNPVKDSTKGENSAHKDPENGGQIGG